jgi:ATP-dependent helicase HrpB
MVSLPIDEHLPRIVAALRASPAVVIVAEPGAGKTTRVPPAIVRAGLLAAAHPNLVMLQPRRVATRAAAERIADENAWRVGEQVGYHVRFEKKLGPATRLRVLTEGILARQLLDDPELAGVGCVVLDEFHERSIHSDLAIALLREVQQSLRDDLKIVVMSATLDAEPVAAFLGGVPIVRVPGRVFPVQIRHAPAAGLHVVDHVADVARQVLREPAPSGGVRDDVLVFLPGAGEIERVQQQLQDEPDVDVLPLHGTLPFEQQARVLRPSSRRKLILATNIAETSLTIDGVTTVIDAGLARVPRFDPDRSLDRLELVRISAASATQRAGRAGRTAPGRCVRLWTCMEDAELEPFELPEILRIDLCPTLLTLHAWGASDPRRFEFFQRPSESALDAAEDLLQLLGAIDGGRLTSLGRQLEALPLHPRLGRLMLEASRLGLRRQGATIAALLSEKDILPPQRREWNAIGSSHASGDSDVLVRLDKLEHAERSRFSSRLWDDGIDPQAARQAARVRDELLARRDVGGGSARTPTTADAIDDALLTLPLLAYPDRVCRRRGEGSGRATMVGGGGVKLADESVVKRGELFVALDARHDARSRAAEAMVRVASRVEADWLASLFPHAVRRGRVVRYDAASDRVIASAQLRYRDLVLRDDPTGDATRDECGRALAEALASRAVELFERDEDASRLLARIELVRRHMPELSMPAFDEAMLRDALAEACLGRRSLAELQRGGLANAIRARLVYPHDRQLDEHAPEAVTVPTGNRIRLQYARGAAAVLAVRLQELFGQLDTPTLAGGRARVLLHLLGPNYRAVQVTDDLRSFWANTYPQVRKDLRARYPKHAWPENPLAAAPVAKGSPTRRRE